MSRTIWYNAKPPRKLPAGTTTLCTEGLSGKKRGAPNFLIPPRHLAASFIF
jgi:hypothetical protein